MTTGWMGKPPALAELKYPIEANPAICSNFLIDDYSGGKFCSILSSATSRKEEYRSSTAKFSHCYIS
jgi:hypothetical protein